MSVLDDVKNVLHVVVDAIGFTNAEGLHGLIDGIGTQPPAPAAEEPAPEVVPDPAPGAEAPADGDELSD